MALGKGVESMETQLFSHFHSWCIVVHEGVVAEGVVEPNTRDNLNGLSFEGSSFSSAP